MLRWAGSCLKQKNLTEPLRYLWAGLIQRTDKLFHARTLVLKQLIDDDYIDASLDLLLRGVVA